MRLSSLTLSGFRCFGPEAETATLGDVTVLVGANGSGKSTVLQALLRLFGTTQAERTIERADFHLPHDSDWESVEEASLRIEAVFQFPELEGRRGSKEAAAACFKHMTVRETGQAPYCRIRLDAKWMRSNLPEGEIEQTLSWVTSPLGTKKEDEKTTQLQGHERSRVHVHYVPASRDPSRQIRQVSGSLLHTLLRAVQWSDGAREALAEASDAIRAAFGEEAGIKAIEDAIGACWKELHGAPEHRHVAIRPVARQLEEFMRHVEATFSPGPMDREDGIDRLSDGQRSLFYLAIVAALFNVQESVGEAREKAISRDQLDPPILNLLAVEEPENHVAPHYLGRIVNVLRRVGGAQRGQVVLTSHSPSILARIEPQEVRHLRISYPKRTTIVRQIALPAEKSEEHKFVLEAVRAYPELYFAAFVVLGEGASEQMVIPRLAEACGLSIDNSLVSVVPLGGRHVNHFWRLLRQLGIPHATLLDLDRERQGGGWSRIKYAVEQLLALGVPTKNLLTVTDANGKESILTDPELRNMSQWDDADKKTLRGWVEALERHGVYFSSPLDLDFMMLRSFPTAYEGVDSKGGGPSIPTTPEKYAAALERLVRVVLADKKDVGSTYNEDQKKAFFWYRYLFLGRSKPSTHILALAGLSATELSDKAPKVLQRLIQHVRDALSDAEA